MISLAWKCENVYYCRAIVSMSCRIVYIYDARDRQPRNPCGLYCFRKQYFHSFCQKYGRAVILYVMFWSILVYWSHLDSFPLLRRLHSYGSLQWWYIGVWSSLIRRQLFSRKFTCLLFQMLCDDHRTRLKGKSRELKF